MVHHTGNLAILFHPVHTFYPISRYIPNPPKKRLTQIFTHPRPDCGLAHITEDAVKTKLKERGGPENEKEVDAMEFGAIKE